MEVAHTGRSDFGWTRRIIAHIPPGQLLRYLVVGTWNTFFGYACFAVLTVLLDRVIAHGYIVANLLSILINVTVAFLGYKWFVFKTKGNYLREWLRVVGIYSTAILISTVMLPVLVFVIRSASNWDKAAPYIAGAVLTGFTVVYSFVGHKKFSFRAESK
jgi:putative flippase GtrA